VQGDGHEQRLCPKLEEVRLSQEALGVGEDLAQRRPSQVQPTAWETMKNLFDSHPLLEDLDHEESGTLALILRTVVHHWKALWPASIVHMAHCAGLPPVAGASLANRLRGGTNE
jgi:hypothetical protein